MNAEDPSASQSTPAGYERSSGGSIRWQPPTVEHLQALLPQYEILSLLGHGGMGAVYKARQITLNRLVAIKLLPPDPAEQGETDFVEQFKNEARTMAMFLHPAIVAVFDFGETTEGQPYFIMEFVEGTDVQKMITSEGRISAEHALAITAHVCDALQYAHARGVVHHDIKPANVLINMEGAVKVADFGLAKMGDSQAGGAAASKMTLGTPDFIAPEALIIDVEVDHRADLYSVGVMLYNMLTGEVPHGEFQPASRCVGCDVRFDAIITRALQTDRERRYQSALEIRQDLDKILTTPIVQEARQSSAPVPKQSGRGIHALSRKAGKTRGKDASSTFPQATARKPWLVPAVLAGMAALGIGGYFIFKPKEPITRSGAFPAADQKPPTTEHTSPVTVVSNSAPEALASAAGSALLPGNSSAGLPPVSASRGNEAPMSPFGTPPTIPATDPSKSLLTATATSPPDLPGMPAELTELETEFQKLQMERVTAPFEADIAKLNAGYLGGLERETANEKTAGHLEVALALETEKRVVQEAGPARLDIVGPVAPTADEDKSSGALKKLHGIYRLEMAKLDAQRASNQAALRASCFAKLKQLEIDLTKAGRLAEAKAVMDYREGLASGVPQKGAVITIPSPAKITTAGDNKDGIPATALVIEALIDGPSELRVKKDGIYWINIKNAKPGRHLGTNEATYINGQPWQPQWKDEKNKNSRDTSNIQTISPSVDISALELKLISVKTKRGEAGIDKRDAIKTKVVDDEFSVLIPDGQGGSRWYKFALVPR